jgi:Cu(I)/Ag(I) efflux system membrane fusion protein
MCKDRIEKTAKSVSGVSSATWDLKAKELHLNYNPEKTNLDAVSKALAKVGHDTEKHKADEKTYNALPSCCKYRK